jgi:hypothetical protein
MGIPHPTVAQMQAEGITNVQDLADFDKEPFNSWPTTCDDLAAEYQTPVPMLLQVLPSQLQPSCLVQRVRRDYKLQPT